MDTRERTQLSIFDLTPLPASEVQKPPIPPPRELTPRQKHRISYLNTKIAVYYRYAARFMEMGIADKEAGINNEPVQRSRRLEIKRLISLAEAAKQEIEVLENGTNTH